jgi:hypothetical protein
MVELRAVGVRQVGREVACFGKVGLGFGSAFLGRLASVVVVLLFYFVRALFYVNATRAMHILEKNEL